MPPGAAERAERAAGKCTKVAPPGMGTMRPKIWLSTLIMQVLDAKCSPMPVGSRLPWVRLPPEVPDMQRMRLDPRWIISDETRMSEHSQWNFASRGAIRWTIFGVVHSGHLGAGLQRPA
jgi:hypothetical protein